MEEQLEKIKDTVQELFDTHPEVMDVHLSIDNRKVLTVLVDVIGRLRNEGE